MNGPVTCMKKAGYLSVLPVRQLHNQSLLTEPRAYGVRAARPWNEVGCWCMLHSLQGRVVLREGTKQ